MRKLFIILCTLVLSSCLSLSYNVQHKKYDSIETPFTTDTLNIHNDILFSLSVSKTTTQNNEFYYIVIEYVGSSWLFIDGDIKIQANDEIFMIHDKKPYRNVLSSGNVQEIIRARIDKESFRKIANSNVVRVQFFGEPTTLNDQEISYINRFYLDVIEGGTND